MVETFAVEEGIRMAMDVDADTKPLSNVDDWLARFPGAPARLGAFPFTSHKIHAIESRRARMSDLLIFDVLLIRGGIRNPDMLFPPPDWVALRNLLHAIDDSVYDILKKDCLVYILLKWAWEMDSREPNSAWDTRYVHDRCIAPQFAALADAYWLLDTGAHLAKAVSILSDARLNRDYVSKVLQALALASSPASLASGAAPATATLVVQYVRTAKPLLTEPDDIDLYALSLAQLSFIDAWAYQKSFPEGGDTRERLFGKIVSWSLTPTPKQEPLAQLLAFPLSSYEESFLHRLALPCQFSVALSGPNIHLTTSASGLILPSQAILILQDLLCVRAIQSGDYVRAIKLDHQFSSVSPSLGSGTSSNIALSSRDTIDRKSIIQDLFAALPPAERTLLEDEIGKVATGVRVNAPAPRQTNSALRRPLMAESSLSASWEDVRVGAPSPSPSTSGAVSASVVGAGFEVKSTQVPPSTANRVNQSPFPPTPRPRPPSSRQAPPVPKFTAFGSPIPATTGVSMGRGVISERGKALFPISGVSAANAGAKSIAHVSLFDTTGSARNTPNAFYNPPPVSKLSVGIANVLPSSATKTTLQATEVTKQNGKAHGGGDDEDVSMKSESDIEIIEEVHHQESDDEEQEVEAATDGGEDDDEDNAGDFITHEKSGVADTTLPLRHVDDGMDEDDGLELGFSVFSGPYVQESDNAGKREQRNRSEDRRAPYTSPPRPHVSPLREKDNGLNASVDSTRSRPRAPPGAFHHEEEEEDEDEETDEDDRSSPTTPLSTPRRSTRTRILTQTPSRPSTRSQPTAGVTSRASTRSARTSSGLDLSQSIPGSLMDEDEDGHDAHSDAPTHGDEDTENDEQEEEEDELAPLPARASRRTRSSGLVTVSTTSSSKSKSTPKAAAKATSVGAAKTKAKARSSEVRTPARRSSRLSMASSVSPDYNEVASPTKAGRKNTGPRGSVAGSGAVATRSSSRRKR